jgi:hypothetical protein
MHRAHAVSVRHPDFYQRFGIIANEHPFGENSDTLFRINLFID